jgi:autoinducer 2-degrading protein
MLVMIVRATVMPEFIDAFRAATLENATASLAEPGVARFDVLQDHEHPTDFVLIEVYRTADDPARHKQTEHYLHWRDTVAPMMAEPREGRRYQSLFPDEHGWDAAVKH